MISEFKESVSSASLVSRLPSIREALCEAFGSQYCGFFLSRNRFLDKKGLDGVLILSGGRQFAVDVKCPKHPPAPSEEWLLPVETWGCKERGDRGYLLSGGKITHYVLWLYPDENWLLLPFRSLAAVLRRHQVDWSRRYRRSTQSTKGHYETYHSECVLVPTAVVAAAVTGHARQYQAEFRVRSSLPIS